jgi:hypothetical protein
MLAPSPYNALSAGRLRIVEPSIVQRVPLLPAEQERTATKPVTSLGTGWFASAVPSCPSLPYCDIQEGRNTTQQGT